MKVRVGAAALLMTLATIDQAFAGFFKIVPTPTPTPTPSPVPEFDGSGAIAAIALLASIVAIIFSRSRKR